MNNIIFLDIDGVLLPFSAHNEPKNKALKEDCYKKRNELGHINHDPFLVYNQRVPFNTEAVSLINTLAAECNAKIVINSDWYMYFKPEILLSKITIEGIQNRYLHEHPIAVRPRRSAGKLHCAEWWFECFTHSSEIHNFVLIDDKTSSSNDRVVSPNSDCGFTECDYQNALKIFRSD